MDIAAALSLIPLASGAALSVALIVGRGFRAARREGETEDKTGLIWSVQLSNPLCIVELVARGFLDKLLSLKGVKGFTVLYEETSIGYAMKVLESKMMGYRVELEYNPSNVKAKNMLEILSRIRDEISKYKDPVKLKIIIFASNASTAREIATATQSIGCGAKVRQVRLQHGKSIITRNFKNKLSFWQVPLSLNSILAHLHNHLQTLALPWYSVQLESIPIGYTLTGPQVLTYLPLRGPKGNIHTVVVGPTGKGKTHLLALLSLLAHLLYGYNVYIVDPKGDLVRELGRLSLLDNVSITDIDLPSCNNIRYRSLLIVDEAWRYASSDCIGRMFRFGRSHAVSVIVASQQPEDIPLSWWNNTGNVVVFGSKDTRYIAMVSRFAGVSAASASMLPYMETGEALVRYDVSGHAIPVRILPLLTIKLRAGS